MRTRRTLRGHLAKIYAMHWGTDSRYLYLQPSHNCATVCSHTWHQRVPKKKLKVANEHDSASRDLALVFHLLAAQKTMNNTTH